MIPYSVTLDCACAPGAASAQHAPAASRPFLVFVFIVASQTLSKRALTARIEKSNHQSPACGRRISTNAAKAATSVTGMLAPITTGALRPAASSVAAASGPTTEPSRPTATAAPTPVPRIAVG